MKLKTFGIDIGTTSIKAVALKDDGGKLSIDAIAVSPFTAKSILSESQINQMTIASSIKDMLQIAQIKTKEVNISIPASQVYTKIIEFPEMSLKELSSSLAIEMEQYIPLPLNQVKTDWQIVDHFTNNGQKTMSVLIIAASIAVLQKYENILKNSGLTPASIETEMISVQRALSPLFSINEASIIVHLGSSATNISITSGGVLRLVATIGLGGLAITRAVSSDLGISTSQAEDLKKTYGIGNNENVQVGKALKPVLESIAADIKRVILTYKEKNQGANISKVIFSGGTALLPGINAFFLEVLGTQIITGNCFGL
jgi:type IV pilus assembly protein PilM